MSYKRADDILPEEIIKVIQQYVDGESIYVPRKKGERCCWGKNTNIRNELQKRNSLIFRDHQKGMKISELAEKYFLSEKSIQRIIYKNKSKYR